jgi:hypothetical protein
VKFWKKGQNCLFVEEEIYNWAAPKSGRHRSLIVIAVLILVAGMLFSLLR